MKRYLLFIYIFTTLMAIETYAAKSSGKYDFSNVWLSHQDRILGYMGTNYQRLYIHFDSIRKKKDSDYAVYGKLKYRNSMYLLIGESHIVSLAENVDLVEGLDGEGSMYKSEVKSEWLLHIRNHRMYEVGVISGVMTSYFDVQAGVPHFFDFNLSYSDGFHNNQFVGKFKKTDNTTLSVCWGAFRVPNCSDLDIGAGEFSPNDKYLPYGWSSYKSAQMMGTEEAWNQENYPWWKKFNVKQGKQWESDGRSFILELYKRLIHGQDLTMIVLYDDFLINNIHQHQHQLLQNCSEETIISLVEKSDSFTDGMWLDTIYRVHFPNGADIYFQITNALAINHIWLPDGTDICYSGIYFYRPAIINDPDGFVNIREKADKNSRIVGKLKERELFYFTPISGSDWYKVYHEEYQPCLGYIHKSRITTFNDFPEDLKEQVRKKGDDCEGGEEE